MIKHDILLMLHDWCPRIGLLFIFSPILWDIFYQGGREFDPIAIGYKGAIMQVIGGLIMLTGYAITVFLEYKTKPKKP